MRVHFSREIPAPPERVWSLLTDPPQMNRWSEARIEALEPGPGGGFGEVGATRRVHAPAPLGMTTVLDEAIVEAEAPNRLVYRVTRGGPIRNHRGEVLIEATEGGSRLTWTVDFLGKVPGTGPFIKLVLNPTLRRSVNKIAEVAVED